jgi:peptidyl-prolyl cis-trans isomerase D
MLSQMRKHAGSWMIKVLLFAIVVVFSFWGVGSFRNSQQTKVAEVNGEEISMELFRQSYNNLYEQYKRVYGNQLNADMLKMLNLRQQALDQIVQRVLLLQEAERLEISVSDEEVAQSIRQYPAFQVNGAFDKDRYFRLLNQIRMSPEEFEQDQYQSLRLQKVQAIVQDGVIVSDAEAHEYYEWFNAEVDLKYVLFSPGSYEDINPNAEEVKAFFDSHKEDYKTDPSVKVRYLSFDPQRYRADIQVSEDQISQYYESHPEEFTTEKTVAARHILLKLDEGADDQTVASKKEKALEIYEEAISGKDFAELAKKYSEGPSRDRGGDLGAFKKDTMVKPFADKAFSMAAGEISEPVRTQFGWHIIKVEKINEGGKQDLAEVNDQIKEALLSDQARTKALEHVERVYDNILDSDDLEEVGKTYDVPVEATDFFTRQNASLEGIGNPRQFVDTAFDLEPLMISDILDLENGFYLMQVVDRKESVIPEFETVAEAVKGDLIKERQNELAKADAEAVLSAVQKEGQLAAAAAPYSVEVKATGFFKRSGSIPDIGYDPKISEQAFLLTTEKPFAEQVLQGSKGWYVIHLKDRKKPLDEDFEKEKSAMVTQLTQQKKQQVFQQWIADIKSRSSIDINQKLVEN